MLTTHPRFRTTPLERTAPCIAATLSFGVALALLAVLCLCAAPAVAQTVHPVQTAPGARAPHPHQEPCWQVAGISKSAMEQRRTITQNTRSQVESVCADTALTISQKHEKIRQIREQARQQEEALVTPSQLEALHACQAERNHNPGVHAGGGHGGGSGPCGDLPGNSAPNKGPGGKPENEPEN